MKRVGIKVVQKRCRRRSHRVDSKSRVPRPTRAAVRVFRLPFLEILKFEVHHGLIMFSSMLVGAAQADLRGFGLEFTKGWFTV